MLASRRGLGGTARAPDTQCCRFTASVASWRGVQSPLKNAPKGPTALPLCPGIAAVPRTRLVLQAAAGSSSSSSVPQPRSGWDTLAQFCEQFTNLFPLWIVLAAGLALSQPSLFSGISSGGITAGLAATMLGMGLTLTLADFTAVFTAAPGLIFLGCVLQYSIMPGLGWAITRYGGLPPAMAVGLIIVACCPGGTASNLVAYIARGDVALSVLMTTASTIGAIFATPLLTAALAGTLVPVDARALFASTLQVVLAPVLLGALANQRFPGAVARLSRFTPAVATLLVAVIVATTLAHSAAAVKASSLQLLRAVATLHAGGFLLGYAASRALGLSESVCRTNSIEVGMQNSTLGAVLAALHFADPLTAAPCAVSACTHSILGSLLAGAWRAWDDRAAKLKLQQKGGSGNTS